jgi:hypothetical protein
MAKKMNYREQRSFVELEPGDGEAKTADQIVTQTEQWQPLV